MTCLCINLHQWWTHKIIEKLSFSKFLSHFLYSSFYGVLIGWCEHTEHVPVMK